MKKLHTLLLVLGLSFLVFLIWKTGIRQLCQQLRAARVGINSDYHR